jgi:hypothetical protein
VHRALITSRILPPVSRQASNRIVRLILHYGFALAFLAIVGGFALAYWNASHANKRVLTRVDAEAILENNRGNIERCIRSIKEAKILNFFFGFDTDSRIAVDILVGDKEEITSVPLFHTRLPGGIYDWPHLVEFIRTHNLGPGVGPEQKASLTKSPSPGVDVSRRLYSIEGNEIDEQKANNDTNYRVPIEYWDRLMGIQV